MQSIRSILILSLALVAGPVYAWGDREQGILAGVIGSLIIQNMVRPTPPQVYYPPQQPVEIYRQPSYTYRPMYKAVDVYIPECNCTRTIMVQIN